MPERYYRSLENIHVNTLPPRAYFIPYESEEALKKPREESAFYTDLNGEWDFAWFANVEELDIESEDLPRSIRCTDKMRVPMCWQLCLDRGYDVPNYINQDYPFPVDPPHLPDVIPCGFYRRNKALSLKEGKSYFINFEGVSSCFYLWINGCFAGYSQVSHCTSEFDITKLLQDGDNLFEVLVVKHCTGSYMEDQDFFRLSGIFRDVYLLERSRGCIRDVFLSAKPVAGDKAEIGIRITQEETKNYRWKLLSPDGKMISEGSSAKDITLQVNDPVLWNPEAPELYTLILSDGEEFLAFETGIRDIRIRDGALLFNGEKIKLKGVNRHDSHPETGYTVTVEDMLNDLYILKRANVNTIRTSHYPNDPRFPGMCDRLGFLLIDEADLESHGMGYNYGDWYWDYWAYLCDAPEWEASCLDRAERLFERDKNHACVLMWSLGNESGCGENHRKMAELIRSRAPGALIHYENARLEYAERLGKDFSDISDVESRMYASLDYLREYLADPERTKPFFFCEYVAAWSTGDIPLHWGEFEDNDGYCGGCVWEFTDHAVNIGTKDKPAFRYGGDFGDYPNDGVYCVDGLVYPDRRPRPGYYDMKECYKPFAAEYENGTLRLRNKKYFTPLSGLRFRWSFEHNGNTLSSGTWEDVCIAPRSTREFALRQPEIANGLLTLNLTAEMSSAAEWADEGYVTGHCQFILHDGVIFPDSSLRGELRCEEDRKSIRITNGDIRYVFDKLGGHLASITEKDAELLSSPLGFSLFRAFHPSNGSAASWSRARYDHAYQKTYSVKLSEVNENRIILVTELSFAAKALPPAVRTRVTYTFLKDGSFTVAVNASVTDSAPALPRFGLLFTMPKQYERIGYLGFGPYETYADRYKSASISRFVTTVTENFEHYVKPTECSAHYRTKDAFITDGVGRGLRFTDLSEKGFSFNALHYEDRQLLDTKHDDELEPLPDTVVHIDYKLHSDNPYARDEEESRAFSEKQFEFTYRIAVLP